MRTDIAIIGGGPAGSTLGSLLKKYSPNLCVTIFEREQFPREHIGESQLPPVSRVLHEMGCWDKVEAANFPIKIGGTFLWGRSSRLWDIQFIPPSEYRDEPRPSKFEGFRRLVAFQVDRAIYDEILLRHAASLGCEVLERTKVVKVRHAADRITGLTLESGEEVEADCYVDASGAAALIRRTLNIGSDCPTQLRNVAIWSYWINPEWAREVGIGGTRIRIISVGFGWFWFIPLGRTKTSVGLVCPAQYLKDTGQRPEDLYEESLPRDPTLCSLLTGARRTTNIRTARDWSFVADRTAGANWFLVGESAGFADPILSAGLTLGQVGASELACTILELYRKQHPEAWLKRWYDENQRRRVRQHIQFADFFYAANGQFTELREHCAHIARQSGLTLTPDEAWDWLSTGGFTNETIGRPGIAGFDLDSARQINDMLCGGASRWAASDYNVFRLCLDGAASDSVPVYNEGRITKAPCYVRGEYRLPLTGVYGVLTQILSKASAIEDIFRDLIATLRLRYPVDHTRLLMRQAMQALEVLTKEGWVEASLDPAKPRLLLETPADTIYFQDGIQDKPAVPA
jgi:flavin-dependent dehydrogenase